MAAVTICSDFGAQKNKVSHCFPSICHEVMGPGAIPAILLPACASSSPEFLMMSAGWQYIVLTYSFSYLELVCCSMSSSNCCFLTCIQVSQEAGQVVLYAHLFQNFPQIIVFHTVKGFGIVNKAEIDVFSGTLLLFPWSSGCWQFDLWFLCLF